MTLSTLKNTGVIDPIALGISAYSLYSGWQNKHFDILKYFAAVSQ